MRFVCNMLFVYHSNFNIQCDPYIALAFRLLLFLYGAWISAWFTLTIKKRANVLATWLGAKCRHFVSEIKLVAANARTNDFVPPSYATILLYWSVFFLVFRFYCCGILVECLVMFVMPLKASVAKWEEQIKIALTPFALAWCCFKQT